ncbi:MAG: hypothetical protein CME62_14065 [Halobacteriovoraceae bacterium]|nr:hypothetical protein [Halobacteriovoraceae bacterium]|tara:strand:+ start:8875 stop:9108 length:234 start_codon:yes stop_codon:yes gene_type:complete
MSLIQDIFSIFKTNSGQYEPKKDNHGRAVANRRGVDTKPNEPFDSIAPPVRMDEEDKKRIIQNRHPQEQNNEKNTDH